MEKSNVASLIPKEKGSKEQKSIKVASEICVFTNDNLNVEKI